MDIQKFKNKLDDLDANGRCELVDNIVSQVIEHCVETGCLTKSAGIGDWFKDRARAVARPAITTLTDNKYEDWGAKQIAAGAEALAQEMAGISKKYQSATAELPQGSTLSDLYPEKAFGYSETGEFVDYTSPQEARSRLVQVAREVTPIMWAAKMVSTLMKTLIAPEPGTEGDLENKNEVDQSDTYGVGGDEGGADSALANNPI